MRLRLILLTAILVAIAVFAWPPSTGAQTVCLPTPPSGAPILNRWPIQTNGADCTDYPLLAVKNQAGGDYVNGGDIWAGPGDTLKVRLYVHNGVLDYPENEAGNVMVYADVPGGDGSQVISAEAWADNADAIRSDDKGGNVTINLAPTDHLEYIPGSAQVYGRGPVLLGSFSDSIVTSGASLGNMPGCFENLRFVTFLVRVVRHEIAPGTINVRSNIPTSWVISGPNNFSGSGTAASYTAQPSGSDYFISVPQIAGYNSPQVTPSISQTLREGGAIDYYINYEEIIIITEKRGTIAVYSNIPTSWVIAGPENFSGSGTSGFYENVLANPSDYTISAPPIAGYNGPSITPSARQTLTDHGIVTYNLNYSPVTAGCVDNATLTLTAPFPATLTPGQTQEFTVNARNSGDTFWYHGSYYQLLQTEAANLNPTYGHISPAMNPGDEQQKTFLVTAPSAEGTYRLNFQMVHRAGAEYKHPDGTNCAAAPGSDSYFGNSLLITYSVRSGGGNPLIAPTLLSADNAGCATIALTWRDNSSNETGFKIMRAPSAAGPFAEIASRPANTTTFTDNPPAGPGYFYRIDAFIESPAQLAPSNVLGPVVSAVCVSDLSQSKKKLVSITEAATGRTSEFTSNTLIRNGDKLVYEILLSNRGNASADITSVIDHLEPNLHNPRNATVARPSGTSTIGISRSGTDIAFGVTGTLPPSTNWVIRFEVTFSTSSIRNTELIKNCATISYEDGSPKQVLVCHGPILVNRLGGGAPSYREVAP